MELVERRATVIVTNPQTGSDWKGRIVGLADHPTLMLEQPDGFRLSLPQTFDVVIADDSDIAQPYVLPPGGRWLEIAFFGHRSYEGYVTEVTLHGDQAAYHIDLPERIWGGNPDAWVEHAANSLFDQRPVSAGSLHEAWKAQVERAEKMRAQREEWARAQEQRALEAGDKPCGCGPAEVCADCHDPDDPLPF